MKKLESLNNAKFQNLSKEQMLKIEGGTVYSTGTTYTMPDPTPENPDRTVLAWDVYKAPSFIGIRTGSWTLDHVQTKPGCWDNCIN